MATTSKPCATYPHSRYLSDGEPFVGGCLDCQAPRRQPASRLARAKAGQDTEYVTGNETNAGKHAAENPCSGSLLLPMRRIRQLALHSDP